MQAKSFKFNFRSRVIRDENGAEIGKAPKNPAIEVDLPILTAAEIIAYLQADPESKESQLIIEQVGQVIFAEAKAQLDEVLESLGDTEVATANNIDFSKLDFSYIANLPPATRTRGPQISDEDWNTFYDDYKAVIIPATGKPEAKINNHIAVFKKPAAYKARRDILGALMEHLDLYVTKTTALDDTGVCVEKLQSRFRKFLAVPETSLEEAF